MEQTKRKKNIFLGELEENFPTKKMGGMGTKGSSVFAEALAAKMSWTLLTTQNLWTTITYHKYIWL